MNRVRWGILSTAQIGTRRVIPAMQQGELCDMVAISSRELSKAQAAASELGIPKAYGSYEELLADPEIDAIYNPLPNHLHVPWTIQALEAGKHVLCEKPIALNAAEAAPLVEAAERHPDLKLMEAFMYRHHPRWHRVLELLSAGEIGELKVYESHFSYFNTDPGNIRNQADIGGGALMDIGCYPVSSARLLFGTEPVRVLASVERDSDLKVDRLTSAILEFDSGRAVLTCSTQMCRFQWSNLIGTTGRMSLDIPYTAWPDKPCHLTIQRDLELEEVVFEPVEQYTLQGDCFARSILEDTPVPTPITDAVLTMKVIDAIFESERTGTWAGV